MNPNPLPTAAVCLPMVAIMGADGCGKTSVIDRLKDYFENCWKIKVCVVHRIHAVKHDEDIRHYEKPAHPYILSIAKLLIVSIEWTFKYFYKFTKLQRQGHFVVFDRHYFYGMAIDPARYRYNGPTSLVRFVNKILPQPDVFILLDAPFEVLVGRKREIRDEQLRFLIDAYRELFDELPSAHIVNASPKIGQVVSEVLQIITNYSKSYEQLPRKDPPVRLQ